ncbi:MAG: TlpA disulfide reductase family protein [Pyrinomonadaceae bacterium]
MKRHSYLLTALVVFSFFGRFGQSSECAGNAQQPASAQLPGPDAVRIAEAFNLWRSLGEKIWPGWTKVSMPLLYITADYEYAIGFPKTMAGFRPLEQSSFDKTVQVRQRVLDPNLSASFPIDGIQAVVIGTPAALEKSSAEWTLTASHEMFHVLQYSRGAHEKIKSLALGSDSDAAWQLNFPFPYKDADVMRLIHLQSYPIYIAANSADESDIKYNAGTGVEAIRVYQSYLHRQSPDNGLYKYSQFQEWTEGIAFYTEYKMAEAAAIGNYQPAEAFQQLPDYKSYQEVWNEGYKNRIFLVKHAGRAAQSRTVFYHLGLGKGLLLDRLMPDWKTRYFAPNVWLNDLLMTVMGQPGELRLLSTGMLSPDFSLRDATGNSVSLNQYRGKVVLIDFWQTWCPPCVEEMPHLQSLQEKYKGEGLVILGVTDRLDPDGLAKWRELVRDKGVNYLTLIDEKGAIAAQFNVSGYPHKFIIDREGRLVYDKRGYQRGDELEVEKKILTALGSKGKE